MPVPKLSLYIKDLILKYNVIYLVQTLISFFYSLVYAIIQI